MSRSKVLRTSKNATLLLIGTITRMVATFAFVLYSADSLGLEGFGKLSLAIHVFELFLGLTATAMAILLTRDIARWPRRLSSLLTSAMVGAIVLCCFAPPIMMAMGIAFNYSTETLWAIGISCIALFPASICMLFEAVFVATERAKFQSLGFIFESLLRISLSIAALHWGYGLMELMWVMVFSRSALLVCYWFCLPKITAFHWCFSYAYTRRFFLRWRVFAAENWMAAIYTNLDVLMLSWISGESAVGLYSAAWKFVRLGAVFSKSFTTAVFPVMSRMFVESQGAFDRLFHHTIRVMSAIALPIIIGVSVLTDRIMMLLYKEEFADAGPVLRILIWVLLLEFLNPFLSHVLFSQGKQQRSMQVAAISLGVNSISIYFLVGRYGATGAAAGCILGGFVATICYLLFASKLSELPRILAEISRVLIAALCMGVIVYFFRFSSWPVIVSVAVSSYVALLFLVQALRIADIRFFRNTFLSRATA